MTTAIAVLLDACRSELAYAYTPGDGRFRLKAGATARIVEAYAAFGLTLGAGFPLRFTVSDRTAKGVNVPGVTRWVEYTATGIDGNDLTGVAVAASHTDAAMNVGDKFFVGWSAGYFNDAAAAIRETQSDVVDLRTDLTSAQVSISALQSGSTGSTNEIWVRPNTDINRDCTDDILEAIEIARAAAASAPVAEGYPERVVRFRPGFYRMTNPAEPITVPPGVSLVGSGRDTVIYQDPQKQAAAFVVGVDDPACTTADRVDLYGLMDASFAPSAGARRGLSSVNNKTFMAQHNEMNLGRFTAIGGASGANARTYWETESVLALDIAFYVNSVSGTLDAGATIAGLGDSGSTLEPKPWVLVQSYTIPQALTLLYATSARNGEYAGLDGTLQIYRPSGTGRLHKLSVQLDLVTGAAAAFINGVQCQIAHTRGSGNLFRENSDWPLHVGRGGFLSGACAPITFCGLRIGNQVRYATGATGSTQAKAGGGTPNDAFRFLAGDANTGLVGYVPLTDAVSSKYLTTIDGRGLPNKAIIATGAGGGGLPNRFERFLMWAGGSGIWVGSVLGLDVRDVRVMCDAGPAMGSVIVNATYPWTIRDSVFASSDACVYAANALVRMADVSFQRQGRDAVRVRASSLQLQNPFVGSIPGAGIAVSAFRSLPGDYGGSLLSYGGELDTEGGASFRENPVVCWNRKGARPTHVTVDGLYAAVACDAKVGVRLRSVPGSNGTARSTYRVPGTNIWEDGSVDSLADSYWTSV